MAAFAAQRMEAPEERKYYPGHSIYPASKKNKVVTAAPLLTEISSQPAVAYETPQSIGKEGLRWVNMLMIW